MKQQNKKLLKRLGTSLASILAAIFLLAPQAQAAVTNQSLAVPMYEYPTLNSFWDDITGIGSDDLPFVILTPANGPGVAVDPIYEAEIAENTADGIRSIGYVHADYQTRDWQEVYDDIDTWYEMYPGISGIFIDLVADGTGDQLCYIAGLYNHVKKTHPNDLVILNPGTHISMNYEPYGDIFMNAENTYAAYQSSWSIMFPGWEDNPLYQNRFWHAIHTVDPSDYEDALALTRANNAGWVYLTDDIMPNPYSETPSYWNTEVADVAELPASTIPNRGLTELPAGCQEVAVTATGTDTPGETSASTVQNLTVANEDDTFPADTGTTFSFALPTGAKLSAASGTNWSCDTSTGDCVYNAPIAASGSAAVLAATFTTDCSYTGGNIVGTLSNFAGNATTWSLTPPKPGCPAGASTGGSLADAGLPVGAGAVLGCALIGGATYVYFVRPRVRYQHVTIRRKR